MAGWGWFGVAKIFKIPPRAVHSLFPLRCLGLGISSPCLRISNQGSSRSSSHSDCRLSRNLDPGFVMKAVHRNLYRPSICWVYRGTYRALGARSFHSSNINKTGKSDDTQPPETSQDALSVSHNTYLDVQIDPEDKTLKTPFGQLPLSPLMDPTFHGARQRFTKPKPRHIKHKSTKWQRHLARNPYGNFP